MNYRKIFLFALISVVALNATAQDNDTYDEQITVQQKKGEFEYSAAAQGSFSHGKTPLWLNANKYGLSSLDETNGYIRGTLQRDISNDKEKNQVTDSALTPPCHSTIRATWFCNRHTWRGVGYMAHSPSERRKDR